jgi:hypothetical protein
VKNLSPEEIETELFKHLNKNMSIAKLENESDEDDEPFKIKGGAAETKQNKMLSSSLMDDNTKLLGKEEAGYLSDERSGDEATDSE